MKSNEIAQFWQEKEKEHKSTFVIATAADYINGCPAVSMPVSGLLYIMHNGIYFENFPNENWFNKLLPGQPHFIKIQLKFPRESITCVSCFHRQKNKQPLTFLQRISLFFSPATQHLIITYKQSEQEQNITFNCLEKPSVLCDAYNRG